MMTTVFENSFFPASSLWVEALYGYLFRASISLAGKACYKNSDTYEYDAGQIEQSL